MVVEIRKVKITKSIFDQLLSPSLTNLSKYEVLGFVFHKARYTLLYDPETKDLCRLATIFDMKIEQLHPQIVNYSQKGFVSSVRLSSYYESKHWIAKIHEIQTEARVKGQIFI